MQQSNVFIALFALGMIFASCRKPPEVDIEGEWRAQAIVAQELADKNDAETVIGEAQFSQHIRLAFEADGRYTIYASTHFLRTCSFSSDISEAELSAIYTGIESKQDKSGSYTLSSDELSLISDGGERIRAKIAVEDADTIVLQGIRFRRVQSK